RRQSADACAKDYVQLQTRRQWPLETLLMNLNDFGTEANNHSKNHQERELYGTTGYYAQPEPANRPIQWKVLQAAAFEVCGQTARGLPAGAYGVNLNQYGEVQFLSRDLQVDDLIDFAESLPSKILEEIHNFWSLGEQFKRYGYLHRRGYLLYGPQGSGKSS